MNSYIGVYLLIAHILVDLCLALAIYLEFGRIRRLLWEKPTPTVKLAPIVVKDDWLGTCFDDFVEKRNKSPQTTAASWQAWARLNQKVMAAAIECKAQAWEGKLERYARNWQSFQMKLAIAA